MTAARVGGRGVHGGRSGSVELVHRRGPVALRRGGEERALDELTFDGDGRSTRARDAGGRVWGVTLEHLFAALAAEGIHEGVAIVLDGDEVPLADGGARAFVEAVRALGLDGGRPRLRVARDADLDLDGSRYVFRAGAGRVVDVVIDFDDARVAPRARWDGGAEDFRARIAPARTFCFARELEALAARGLASHADPASVVVLAEDEVLASGAPFSSDEPARHKLLDLVGDLYAYGGPPLGEVHARRPGHRVTHEIVRWALAEGVLERV